MPKKFSQAPLDDMTHVSKLTQNVMEKDLKFYTVRRNYLY